ncbi:MAG: DrmB family protein, partial [Oligoflexus sp.]
TTDQQSEAETVLEAEDFKMLAKMYAAAPSSGNFVPPHIQSMITHVAENHGLAVEQVKALLDAGSETGSDAEDNAPEWNEAEILLEEWTFLKSAAALNCSREDLVCRESDPPRFKGKSPFDRIILIERLREVRSFMGYRRIDPSGELVTPSGGRSFEQGVRPWLPAVEIYGEGIFLSFDEEWVQRWEGRLAKNSEEIARVDELEQKRLDANFWFLPSVSPRQIAIHTFAHLLMRQLVFESGYSSSALRERIYAAPGMAGLLIYTADGDSEGSLGGLVRQGQPNRLGDTLLLSLDKAKWCSADPVCSETNGQGLGGFNRAACHACSLVPETSCTTANTLLDRGLLLGRDGVPGLLGDLV